MMLKALKKEFFQHLSAAQASWHARAQAEYMKDHSFTEAWGEYKTRNEMHLYMHHYFSHSLDDEIKSHRIYYKQDQRGFGEDAFHAMWFTLLNEFRPTKCLEIGVYRGQVISLWSLISRRFGFETDIHGIAPFTPSGDQVSVYLRNIDYHVDVLSHHRHFGLKAPSLIKAFSTDDIAINHIQSSRWDLIYIDGSHDYDVALADYQLCKEQLAQGGLLVMDDSSLYSDYKAPMFSFAGHPGPSRVVQDFAMKELRFIGAVGHNNVFMKT